MVTQNLKNKKVVIFDMDDTLSDTSHRRHLVEAPRGQKNWPAFYDACGEDSERIPFIDMALQLAAADYTIVIFSGRLESCRAATEHWLKDRGIEPALLLFRQPKQFKKTHQLKSMWLDSLLKEGAQVVMAVDDDDSNLQMFQDAGLLTLDAKNIEQSFFHVEKLLSQHKKNYSIFSR